MTGWLDITDGEGTRREALEAGLTKVGGPDADIPFSHVGRDSLHFWDDPPRVVFVGQGDAPLVKGRPFSETPLSPGDRIQWAGRSLVYGGKAAPGEQATLEEIPIEENTRGSRASGTRRASLTPREALVWKRLIAGMALEQGMADAKVAKRWQESVVQGRFDPDACAEEILVSERVDREDDRLLHRSGRLLRDFLMARGAGRKARRAARGGLAFLLAQGLAFLALAGILVACMILLRLKGVSFDEFLDRILMR